MNSSSDRGENEIVELVAVNDREQRIRSRIAQIRAALSTDETREAARAFPECGEAAERASRRLREIETKLQDVPPIDVVVLGPSRHGKSTLLNSLVQTELLPTSDIKPCTASVLTLTWAPEWAVHIKFVGKKQLLRDLRDALADARQAVLGQAHPDDDITADEPRFIKTVLQRFIQLFRIDPDLPPDQLLKAVEAGVLPADLDRHLGMKTQVKAKNLEGMQRAVEKYLSTKDIYWTVVEECQIQGPFPDWHPSLELVDLPGTNDTDPQRTAVTNSLRESATAVAIVTSDSNIGPDIESWLRNSSVLANFLEATVKRRQRLFIIRTKLDSYHPNLESMLPSDASEEDETRIHLNAVEDYKREQAATYRSMLRDIAGPKLPAGDDADSRARRTELLARIDDIRVFFVSALAHEVFAERFPATRRTRRQLGDYFDDDIEATGIPSLRNFLTEVARGYLAENFYEDLERSLESEVSLLAQAFRKAVAAAKAKVAGGQQTLQHLVTTVRSDLLPWLDSEVARRSEDFRVQSLSGANGISQRLAQVEAMSNRRFEDKITIWTGLHWASLKSTARKGGAHVTGRGRLIDINEDICSVLVDDVLLAWTHFRDHLISEQVSTITNGLAEEIGRRLEELQAGHGIPEVAEAVHHISMQLMGITNQQRLQMLQSVNDKIKQVESIRKPAYAIAQEEMSQIFRQIADESGTGCSVRMQESIRRQAPAAIRRIRERVNELITDVVTDLASTCTTAIASFGNSAAKRIGTAIEHVSDSLAERDQNVLQSRVLTISAALKRLPAPDVAA